LLVTLSYIQHDYEKKKLGFAGNPALNNFCPDSCTWALLNNFIMIMPHSVAKAKQSFLERFKTILVISVNVKFNTF
jgi:hypothetical protein